MDKYILKFENEKIHFEKRKLVSELRFYIHWTKAYNYKPEIQAEGLEDPSFIKCHILKQKAKSGVFANHKRQNIQQYIAGGTKSKWCNCPSSDLAMLLNTQSMLAVLRSSWWNRDMLHSHDFSTFLFLLIFLPMSLSVVLPLVKSDPVESTPVSYLEIDNRDLFSTDQWNICVRGNAHGIVSSNLFSISEIFALNLKHVNHIARHCTRSH